jgi:DNA-binding transcriptional regulator LsrR (DeoR family)
MTRPSWFCVPPRRRIRWYPSAAAEVHAMFVTGMDTNDIARHLGIHESEIVRALDSHRAMRTVEVAA